MPKGAREFFDPTADTTLQWQRVHGDSLGLTEKILSLDPETGDCTRLLKFPPGISTSANGTLRHDFWEEVWILAGEIRDTRLDAVFSQGMYACRPPGMPHGPWTSVGGALTFEVRYRTARK